MSGIDTFYQFKHRLGIHDDWGISSYRDPHFKKSVNPKKISHKKSQSQIIIKSNKILPYRISYFEDIQKLNQNVPGPGQYKSLEIFKTPTNKNHKIINNESKSINYLTNLQNQKKNIPGVGKYNINDSTLNPKKKFHTIKINQSEQQLQKLVKQKFQKDYNFVLGPGSYNIHYKQIGKHPIKSKFLPQKANFPKINNKQQPNFHTYTPVPSYQTFQKMSIKHSKSLVLSKVSKQKRFYNPQQRWIKKKPGPADYKLNVDWGNKKNNKINNIFSNMTKGVPKRVYY